MCVPGSVSVCLSEADRSSKQRRVEASVMDLERRREVRRRIAELALAPSVDQLQPSAAQPGECSESQLPGGSLETDHRIPGYWGGDLAWPADESTYPSGMAKVKVCG